MKDEASQLAKEGKYNEALEKYAESVKLAEDGSIMLPPGESGNKYILRERAYNFFNVTHHLIANHQDDEISCELEQLPPPDLSAIGFREFLEQPSPKSIKLNLINDAPFENAVAAIHRGYVNDESRELYIDVVKFPSEDDVASFFDNNRRGYVSGNRDSRRKITVAYTIGSEKDNCAMAYWKYKKCLINIYIPVDFSTKTGAGNLLLETWMHEQMLQNAEILYQAVKALFEWIN